MKNLILIPILVIIKLNFCFALGEQERQFYNAYKVVKTARAENRKKVKEEQAHKAFLIEKKIIDNLGESSAKNIGGEEAISLTKDTGDIISTFLNDGLFFKGNEILSTTKESSEEQKLAERFLHTTLDFKLALANQLKNGETTCEQQYFSSKFDPTLLDQKSALTLDNLPMDPRFLRRLALAVPKEGFAEYYFHNGVGDVVKISFLKNKPTFQLYTMMTYHEDDSVKKIGSSEHIKIEGMSVTVGTKHQVAEKKIGKTGLSLSADTAITSQFNGLDENEDLESTISGASAEASLLAERGNKTLLFTGGIKAICRNNSNCDDITDYRHIQLGSMRFDNPTWYLDGKISTESNVLTAEVKRGDYKGSKAVIDQSGDIDLTGKYHAYILEQEVRYSVHANRKSNGEQRLDISVEDSHDNKYNFNQNKDMTRLSMQNTIFKSKQTTCTGIYEVFERHENRSITVEYKRGEVVNEGYYDPRYGSDAFDAKGAGVAVTIHCKS